MVSLVAAPLSVKLNAKPLVMVESAPGVTTGAIRALPLPTALASAVAEASVSLAVDTVTAPPSICRVVPLVTSAVDSEIARLTASAPATLILPLLVDADGVLGRSVPASSSRPVATFVCSCT